MNSEMKSYNFLQAKYISEKKLLVFNLMVDNFIIKRKKKYLTESFAALAHCAYGLGRQTMEDLRGNRKVLKQENAELFKKFKSLKKRLSKQKKLMLSQKDDSLSRITLSFSNNDVARPPKSSLASSNVNSLMTAILSNQSFLRFYQKTRSAKSGCEKSNIVQLYREFTASPE